MLRPTLLALMGIAIFAVSGLRHLDTVPQVYEDEPWQASTAYKLMTSGVFGSDLFAGFYNMDQRYYGFMPLHPLLLSIAFRALGVGLAEARVETVVLSLVVLLLTFWLGVRLFDAWVGAVAVLLLVLVRWTGLTYVQQTGIPLVDLARIARYDPLVPVIGLAALHVYLSARPRRNLWIYGAAGLLAGLAGLAHVYGLFWIPALALLALLDRNPRACAVLVVASVVPWLPYAAYVLADYPDWRGQTAIYASRFELLDPRWYLDNLLQEYHRYGPGLGPPGAGWLARPGSWFLLIALPLSLFALARRAVRCHDFAARAVVVPALLFPILFALFIKLKLVNYTLIELPLWAIAVAWGVLAVWRRGGLVRADLAGSGGLRAAIADWRLARVGLALVGAVVALEGAAQLGRLEALAASTTPYPTFVSEIRALVPSGARVLGLHSYWLGMQDAVDYRSFLVPLNWADEGMPLDQALSRASPDVILLDARMREYFDSPPAAADRQRFYAWLGQHGARLIGRLDDPTYGLMEVYRLQS